MRLKAKKYTKNKILWVELSYNFYQMIQASVQILIPKLLQDYITLSLYIYIYIYDIDIV